MVLAGIYTIEVTTVLLVGVLLLCLLGVLIHLRGLPARKAVEPAPVALRRAVWRRNTPLASPAPTPLPTRDPPVSGSPGAQADPAADDDEVDRG